MKPDVQDYLFGLSDPTSFEEGFDRFTRKPCVRFFVIESCANTWMIVVYANVFIRCDTISIDLGHVSPRFLHRLNADVTSCEHDHEERWYDAKLSNRWPRLR